MGFHFRLDAYYFGATALRRRDLAKSLGKPTQSLEEAVEQARLGERSRIARHLHAGILQELTVAGFQLRALHKQVPASARPAVDDLASWLEIRQAELRHLVAELQGGSTLHSDFTAVIDEARELGCTLTLSIEPAGAKIDSMFRIAVRAVLSELVRAVATELGGQQITAQLTLQPLPRLVVAHDGAAFGGPGTDIDQLRRFIGAGGAALSLGTPDGPTDIVIDWNG